MALYPLKFNPIFIDKVWGGRKIGTLARDLPGDSTRPIGESWEVADFDDARSVVANGPLAGRTLASVIEEYGDTLLCGLHLTPEGGFPLLVKYLDANENLSVQVHPDETYLQKHPEVRLKSEAWYVIDADPGAVIYRGLKPGVTPEQFRAHIEDGSVVDDLIAIPSKKGKCFYLPSGTCHALGAGVLVAEVQTPSDTTFRVFDWGRTDRTLHIDEALECIHFRPPDVAQYEERRHIGSFFTTVSRLCSCEHFRIEKIRMVEGYGQEIPYDRPAIWMVLEGAGKITGTPAGVDVDVRKGDVILMPGGLDDARIDLAEDTVWLDIQFPELLIGEVE